jgi:hypothetical protein
VVLKSVAYQHGCNRKETEKGQGVHRRRSPAPSEASSPVKISAAMSLMVVLNNAKDLGSHVVSVQRNSDDWLSASAPGAAAFTHALYLSLGRALQEIRLWRLRQNAGICSKPTQMLSVLSSYYVVSAIS